MSHGHGVDNWSLRFNRKGRAIGSWGEQISDADFPLESATRFPPIVRICVHIQSRADGDDGDDGDGDGVSKGNYST